MANYDFNPVCIMSMCLVTVMLLLFYYSNGNILIILACCEIRFTYQLDRKGISQVQEGNCSCAIIMRIEWVYNRIQTIHIKSNQDTLTLYLSHKQNNQLAWISWEIP